MYDAYRCADEQVLRGRLSELERRRAAITSFDDRLRGVRAARAARIMCGIAGIAGAFAVVALTIAGDREGATHALLGATCALPAVYALARLLFGVFGRSASRVGDLPPLRGPLARDLSLLDGLDPLRRVERSLGRLEAAATALPLVALSLLLPLTIHWLFLTVTNGGEGASSFGGWIAISCVLVGHAHIALAGMAIAFARKLRKTEDVHGVSIHREWARAWAVTIGAGALPGALFYLIPPLLVAVTGIVFIPFMFVWIRGRVAAEREVLELAAAWVERVPAV